ncbi:MAG: undecaprenyldiphospho-muramoylpentapeptide beta-N-acetylglucosaminyltransferase [Beijerinckiaceae bacterium]|nr:undecaprenyldiphospho-muramoylpentapeptide beta-N-acetylglucosaminyltransferase [Beijerinckiaceae bacterium]
MAEPATDADTEGQGGERLHVVLAAGGTGGHLFPAEALSHVLQRRGVVVSLVTDLRAIEFTGGFPAEAIHAVPAATPSGRSLGNKIKAGFAIVRGVLAARTVLKELDPDVVVGFGGYPTVPPLLAASLAGYATIVHEQNAVVGRANRFLAGRVDCIATGFAQVGGLGEAMLAKCRHVGNPVRTAVTYAANAPFRPVGPEGHLRVLVFGGSQGARVMADVVPTAVQHLTPEELARITIVQQARVEDHQRVTSVYQRLGVRHEVSHFFDNLPEQMAAAQLVIARSGASTVAELGVIGRPSILVPLPGALDQDQMANARTLAAIGAATVIAQPDFTPKRLASELSLALAEPDRLTAQATAARTAGLPDAAERLADLVMKIARQE